MGLRAYKALPHSALPAWEGQMLASISEPESHHQYRLGEDASPPARRQIHGHL